MDDALLAADWQFQKSPVRSSKASVRIRRTGQREQRFLADAPAEVSDPVHDDGVAVVVPVEIGRKVVDRGPRDDEEVVAVDDHVGIRKVEQEAAAVVDHPGKDPVLRVARVEEPEARPVDHARVPGGALKPLPGPAPEGRVPVAAAVPRDVVHVPVGVGHGVVDDCRVGDADAGGECVAQEPGLSGSQLLLWLLMGPG